jgi:hypothetical protein
VHRAIRSSSFLFFCLLLLFAQRRRRRRKGEMTVEATIFRPLTIFSFKHFGANRNDKKCARQTNGERVDIGRIRRRVV